MSLTVIRPSRPIPSGMWDVTAMRQYASAVHAAIVERTFDRGIGEDGRPLRRYSTRPMTVSFGSSTAKRLAPKGGEPAYGRGRPRRMLVNGRPPKGSKWVITGRHYANGYGEFKLASRRGLVNRSGATGVLVDLTLSGQMRRSFRVTSVSRSEATVSLTGAPREYGPGTDARRPWIGLSNEDERDLRDVALPAIIRAAMDRSR